jgi:hypothetical protein
MNASTLRGVLDQPNPAVYPCRQQPDAFHAPAGEHFGTPGYLRRVNTARELCFRCPIKLSCREQGRQLREPGIWGGETDEERAAAGYPTPETVKKAHKKKHEARKAVAA